MDYDRYAAGEAGLGWMNASAKLHARNNLDWRAFAADLLESIRGGLRGKSAEIAHLKLFLSTSGASVAGNVTSNDSPLFVRGQIDPNTRTVSLLINARVHIQPEILHAVVEECLRTVAGSRIETTITNIRSFFPGRPQPTYRYQRVV